MRVALCFATAAACAPPGGARQAPADATVDSTEVDARMADWQVLFDGVLTDAWRMSTIINQPGRDDPGRFEVAGGALIARPGTDLGLLWHTAPVAADFELALEWRQSAADDNSGVFVRFPDLDSKGYDNTAYVAVHFGFEVQIDNTGRPDGAPRHTTGAIYDVDPQDFTRVTPRPLGEWNDYRIRVVGRVYEVFLGGTRTTRFESEDAERGRPAPAFIGLQTHTGNVAYRRIRVRAL
jgi:hypothetical protein